MGTGKFSFCYNFVLWSRTHGKEPCVHYFTVRHWLQLRDTQLMVKGKGYMQTYWCEICSIDSSIADSSTIPFTMTDGSSEDGRVVDQRNSNDACTFEV